MHIPLKGRLNYDYNPYLLKKKVYFLNNRSCIIKNVIDGLKISFIRKIPFFICTRGYRSIIYLNTSLFKGFSLATNLSISVSRVGVITPYLRNYFKTLFIWKNYRSLLKPKLKFLVKLFFYYSYNSISYKNHSL